MEDFAPVQERSPWTQAVITLLVALAGFIIIGPVVGMFLAFPFYEGTPLTFMDDLQHPLNNPSMKNVLFVMQGAASFIGLALIPAFFFYKSKQRSVFSLTKRIDPKSVAMVTGIVIFFMGFNSVFVQWNATLQLPEFMEGFETWAREKEQLATQLSQYLTTFDSFGQFLIGLLVIAVFASVGEELVFRGLLQPELHKATKNIHAAIWISAILFSALHMQFFGFVPRVLLGALFGYLYHWSGNLSIVILAHFINNGFLVWMIYRNKTSIAGMDMENAKAAPWPVVAIFTILTAILLYYFRKREIEKRPA